MSRKLKYSKELKLEIVKRYLAGESSSFLARKYNLPKRGDRNILTWANRFRVLGENGFNHSKTNKSYSKEFKLEVINKYLSGEYSYHDLANHYNISSCEVVRQWVLAYNSGEEIMDYSPKSEVYTMKSRNTTLEEKLEIVKYVLDNNNDYKGAADYYNVPYVNIYNWVKKYIDKGEDSLYDRRGRPSSHPTKSLTELEKKEIEIDKLKRQLERERKVNEVFKKNLEIRTRMEKNSHALDNKIFMKR